METSTRSVFHETDVEACIDVSLQCADLTLSANLTSVPDQTCENTTSTTPHGSGSGGHDASPSATAPGSTQTGGALGVSHGTSAATAVLLAVAGIAAAL